jgi:hypothetical protein
MLRDVARYQGRAECRKIARVERTSAPLAASLKVPKKHAGAPDTPSSRKSRNTTF